MTAFFSLLETEGKELADNLFVGAPDEHLSRKKVDERDGKHVADNANRKQPEHIEIVGDAHRDRAAQLNDRYHRDKKANQIPH